MKINSKKQLIYFVQAGDNGLIKIGKTSKFNKKRFVNMQVDSPQILKLLCTIEGDDNLETILQARFSEYCSHGEWFEPGAALIKFISEILNTDIDLNIGMEYNTCNQKGEFMKTSFSSPSNFKIIATKKYISRYFQGINLKEYIVDGRAGPNQQGSLQNLDRHHCLVNFYYNTVGEFMKENDIEITDFLKKSGGITSLDELFTECITDKCPEFLLKSGVFANWRNEHTGINTRANKKREIAEEIIKKHNTSCKISPLKSDSGMHVQLAAKIFSKIDIFAANLKNEVKEMFN